MLTRSQKQAKARHFAARCYEYGIRSEGGYAIWKRVMAAIGDGTAEHVLTARDKTEFYRFFVDEGAFYAVYASGIGVVVTVFTQDMMANRKRVEGKRRHGQALERRPFCDRNKPFTHGQKSL